MLERPFPIMLLYYVCVSMHDYIIDWREGSPEDKGAEEVCAFDAASVALNTVELTVHIKPSGQGDHAGPR